MEIILEGLSKRYQNHWIFKNFNLHISPGEKLAVIGPNGSGKSTLIKIISGALIPTSGKISYRLNSSRLSSERIFKYLSFTAPYIELIEEFTLKEIVRFHQAFKPFNEEYSIKRFVEFLEYPFRQDQYIKGFSSGMKQRLQLGLSLLANTPLLLLDEPGSNLDKQGKEWFQRILKENAQSKTVIIASNEPDDYLYCERVLNLEEI
jgi:ABC-type multidrug transport system ATPase subunit